MAATWATGPEEKPDATLARFQEGLSVDLVATKRNAFRTCAPGDQLASIVARNRDNSFDFLPVVESDGQARPAQERIVGLVELVPFMHDTEPQGQVRDHMRPLSEDNLIGADASILSFVRSADRHRCRLVVSGSEMSGLVSLSDLQRLPVRAALFAMVTHLEITMAGAIRREFENPEDSIRRLSPGRQEKVHDAVENAKSRDAYVHTLLLTQFCDKVAIIRKSPAFQWGRNAFEEELAVIEALRNDLAHANDYASTRDAACKTCETVRMMDEWIERLAAWPAASAGLAERGDS